MANRSKIVIDVDSFIRAWTFPVQVAQQNQIPRSTTASIVSWQPSPARHAAPHRFQTVTFGRFEVRFRELELPHISKELQVAGGMKGFQQ
jgi:hypothetical protein